MEIKNPLELLARDAIMENLKKLPESNHEIFKRMYSHKDLQKPIEAVVADMSTDRLDWALQQVMRSVDELEKK